MAAAFWSESMGMGAKLRLQVGVQKQTNDLLHQFIRPGLHAQWTFGAVLLWNRYAPGWTPPVAFMSKVINDRLDLVQCHAISRFLCGSFGHRTRIAVDAPVGRQKQVRVVQQSIDALQRQPFLASLT